MYPAGVPRRASHPPELRGIGNARRVRRQFIGGAMLCFRRDRPIPAHVDGVHVLFEQRFLGKGIELREIRKHFGNQYSGGYHRFVARFTLHVPFAGAIVVSVFPAFQLQVELPATCTPNKNIGVWSYDPAIKARMPARAWCETILQRKCVKQQFTFGCDYFP